MSPKALVLGSTGMLGSAVFEALVKANIEARQASRTTGFRFDAERESCEELIAKTGLIAGDYIVNCVGVTKTHIRESAPSTVSRAVRLNALFPIALSQAAERSNIRVIQVATDCVFSGERGRYSELTAHDAHDVYGKSKSIGEVKSSNVLHLRCSLVGPELPGRRTLFFDWVRYLDYGSQIEGFVDHKWNGLTSRAFGAIISGIIASGNHFPGVQHLVPADALTKYELIKFELDKLGRKDVTVHPTVTGSRVDRTLATEDLEKNTFLFRLGGFRAVPTIGEMMEGLPWEELRVR
ncbi:sugar nucleotide-binding protein [Aquiluna sp.]|nr:sugar nucleotide-binding protein [Aquiluna sp.]